MHKGKKSKPPQAKGSFKTRLVLEDPCSFSRLLRFARKTAKGAHIQGSYFKSRPTFEIASASKRCKGTNRGMRQPRRSPRSDALMRAGTAPRLLDAERGAARRLGSRSSRRSPPGRRRRRRYPHSESSGTRAAGRGLSASGRASVRRASVRGTVRRAVV